MTRKYERTPFLYRDAVSIRGLVPTLVSPGLVFAVLMRGRWSCQATRAAGCVRGRSRPARAEHAQCGNSDERQDPQISMVHANLPRFSVQARLRPPVYTQRSSLVNQLLSDPGCLAADLAQ